MAIDQPYTQPLQHEPYIAAQEVKHSVTIPLPESSIRMEWLDLRDKNGYSYHAIKCITHYKGWDIPTVAYRLDFYNSELYTEFCLRWL